MLNLSELQVGERRSVTYCHPGRIIQGGENGLVRFDVYTGVELERRRGHGSVIHYGEGVIVASYVATDLNVDTPMLAERHETAEAPAFAFPNDIEFVDGLREAGNLSVVSPVPVNADCGELVSA